jgi:L-fuconolactonase
MKIDAEVHFWKFNKLSGNQYIRDNKILNQDYLPEQITQNLHRNGIEGCITVAVDDSEVETRFLSELAATHPEILAVIGWLDLYDSKASDKIREFQQYKPIRGYFIEFENDRELSAGVMELLNENQYSLDFTMRQGMNTNSVDKWLNAYPDQQFILQKGGSPDTGHGPTTAWENQIHELAKNKNLSCKLTGLLTGGSNLKSWSPKDFYPFLDILFDSFGTDRLLFASDWPFLLLAGSYVQWKSLVEKFMEKFTADDRDKIFGENAQRLYRI